MTLREWTESFATRTVKLITSLPSITLYALLVPVISYYLLRDRKRLYDGFLSLFPPPVRSDVIVVWEEVDDVLFGYIRGNLLVALIVSILASVCLFFCGVDYAAVLGTFYGILDLIPYFGPALGIISVTLLSAVQGNVNVFIVLIWIIAVQQLESMFLSPKILGDQVGLHPVSVIVLVLIGGYIGGLLGMVLMIPVAAMAKVILKYCYEKFVMPNIH